MKFLIGTPVRYKPGTGTYGYEDSVGADGRVFGVVVGHTPTKVKVRLALSLNRTVVRPVAPTSLVVNT